MELLSSDECGSGTKLYLEKVLAPTLAKGEVVTLDNRGSHKGKPARNAIRARALSQTEI